MRLYKLLLALLFVVALAPITPYSWPQDLLTKPLQRGILAWDGGKEVMVYSAVVVPTMQAQIKVVEAIPFPSRVNVTELKLEILEEFQDIVSPYYSFVITPPIGTEISPSTLKKLIPHDKLFTVEISEVDELIKIVNKELTGWLYHEVRGEIARLALEYINKGFRYWVIDVYRVPPGGGVLKPLKIAFKSDRLYYPFKALSFMAGGRTEIVDYVLTKVPLPYIPRGWSMASIRMKEFPKLDKDIYSLCGKRPWLSALHFNDLTAKLSDLEIKVPLGKGLLFLTGRKKYYLNEPVRILLMNLSNSTILLPNTAPWEIADEKGTLIYVPMRRRSEVKLRPGDSLVWTWYQVGGMGVSIKPGTYLVKLKLLNGTVLEYTFEVAPRRGEKRVVVIPPITP